jgi:hypothetical protein
MSDELKFELPHAPQQKQRCGTAGALLALMIGVVAGSGIHALVTRSADSQPQAAGAELLSHDELTTLADKLERNQLYVQAARAWQKASALRIPEGDERAETLFRIGKNLNLGGEHDEAVRYLLAAEAADKKGQWSASINQMMLESLSALGLEEARAYQAKKRIALAPTDDQPIAEIGGEPITTTDLNAFAREMVESQLAMQKAMMLPEQYEDLVETQVKQSQAPEGREQLLQAYLSRELLYREALAEGLAEQDAVRDRMLDARRTVLIGAFMDDYLAKSLQLTDTDVTNAYEAKRTEYIQPEAVKAQVIVASKEQDKKAIDTALTDGKDFAELQKQYNDQGKPDMFDRWLTRDGWVPMVKEPKPALAHLFLLDKGEVDSKWFETNDGEWVRFRLADKRDQRQLKLDECRDRVERDLRDQRRRELIDQLQDKLRSKYEVVIHQEPTTQPGNDS